jgi:hypothetical protein
MNDFRRMLKGNLLLPHKYFGLLFQNDFAGNSADIWPHHYNEPSPEFGPRVWVTISLVTFEHGTTLQPAQAMNIFRHW